MAHLLPLAPAHQTPHLRWLQPGSLPSRPHLGTKGTTPTFLTPLLVVVLRRGLHRRFKPYSPSVLPQTSPALSPWSHSPSLIEAAATDNCREVMGTPCLYWRAENLHQGPSGHHLDPKMLAPSISLTVTNKKIPKI